MEGLPHRLVSHVDFLKEFDKLPPIEIPKLPVVPQPTPEEQAEKIAMTAINEVKLKNQEVKQQQRDISQMSRLLFEKEKRIDALERELFGQKMYVSRIKSRVQFLIDRLKCYEPVMADSFETLLMGPKEVKLEPLPTGINKKIDDPPVDSIY